MKPAQPKQVVAGIAVLFVIALLVVGVVATNHKSTSTNLASTTTSSSTTKTASTKMASATYKDGTYSAKGSYNSPGGQENIAVSVTLQSNKVADATATSGATDTEAEYYQNQFISSFKTQVVGKPISSIKLSRVGGSSLTSQGFNDALKQIEQQAAS